MLANVVFTHFSHEVYKWPKYRTLESFLHNKNVYNIFALMSGLSTTVFIFVVAIILIELRRF